MIPTRQLVSFMTYVFIRRYTDVTITNIYVSQDHLYCHKLSDAWTYNFYNTNHTHENYKKAQTILLQNHKLNRLKVQLLHDKL